CSQAHFLLVRPQRSARYRLEFRSAHRLHPERSPFARHAPNRKITSSCGSTATGIRRRVIITGTEATGRVRHMLARSGSFHSMQRAATTVATGEVRAGVSSMTITGTMTAIGTAVAGTKTTASTKAGTKKIVTTTIGTKKLN